MYVSSKEILIKQWVSYVQTISSGDLKFRQLYATEAYLGLLILWKQPTLKSQIFLHKTFNIFDEDVELSFKKKVSLKDFLEAYLNIFD